MTDPCTRCEWTGHATIAVGRFTPGGPRGYRGAWDGSPIRATRAEAERDVCDRQRARWLHSTDRPQPGDVEGYERPWETGDDAHRVTFGGVA